MLKIIEDAKQLRIASKEVKDKESIVQLVKNLKEILSAHPEGIAISGVQVGDPQRVIVLKTGKASVLEYKIFTNPVIVEHSREGLIAMEGCLSFPNVFIKTRRHNEIEVECDEIPDGIVLRGLASRALQHEIDHLQGILMFDREYIDTNKVGRNEKCICGSGKKYKKCCGK